MAALGATQLQGHGGAIVIYGRVVGSLGDWSLRTFGDAKPFFAASGCVIPAYWLSAGVAVLVTRPLQARQSTPRIAIRGTVKRMTRDTLSLGDIEILPASYQEGAAL